MAIFNFDVTHTYDFTSEGKDEGCSTFPRPSACPPPSDALASQASISPPIFCNTAVAAESLWCCCCRGSPRDLGVRSDHAAVRPWERSGGRRAEQQRTSCAVTTFPPACPWPFGGKKLPLRAWPVCRRMLLCGTERRVNWSSLDTHKHVCVCMFVYVWEDGIEEDFETVVSLI